MLLEWVVVIYSSNRWPRLSSQEVWNANRNTHSNDLSNIWRGKKKYAYEKVKPWKFNFLLTDKAAATEKHMSKNKHNCNV